MLKLSPHEIEQYLRNKGLRIRRRGSKAEIERCPFCGGNTEDKWTCVVYLDERGGNFKCMRGSCDRAGTFWQLAEQLGDDPKDFYSPEHHAPPARRLKKDPVYHKEEVEPQKFTDKALAYLKKRGFSEETLENLSIWCDEHGLINFGYYHKGELCMVKVRKVGAPKAGEPKAWQRWKGGLRTLWGIEQCDPSTPYIVVAFGEYDRIALAQARIPNTVSVPAGDQDLEWIETCWDELQKYNEIILWPDNDESGRKAIPKIAERLGRDKVRVVKCDYKDPNEMLGLRGKEASFDEAESEMFDLIATAPWYWQGDLKKISDIGHVEQNFTGYLSGIASLDKILGGFFLGGLTVHAGSHKAGKSSLINQVVCMAAEQGGRVCVWPGEDPLERFKYNISVHVAGWEGVVRTSDRTGTEYTHVPPEYQELIDDWLEERLIVLDRKAGLTEEELLENFELAYRRYGCDTFVVDNLMKLVNAKDAQNTNSRQSRIVNMLADFAKEFNVHVHLVVHTNKAGDPLAPPQIETISGTKDIANLADRVLILWRIPEPVRDSYGGYASLLVVAADRVFGAEEKLPLKYIKEYKRFGVEDDELAREYSVRGPKEW